jgi:DnaJ-class molecular chaperone
MAQGKGPGCSTEEETFERNSRGHQQDQERVRGGQGYRVEPEGTLGLDWCYRLLGVTSDATLDEIERAYRHKAKVHHPDHKGDGDVMRLLNEARQKLRKALSE